MDHQEWAEMMMRVLKGSIRENEERVRECESEWVEGNLKGYITHAKVMLDAFERQFGGKIA